MKIFVGYDSRENDAYSVCINSLFKYNDNIQIYPLVQHELRKRLYYNRPENEKASTEFAFTRFLVPILCNYTGWAVFMDCDILCTRSLKQYFDNLSNNKAIYCVKHDYTPRSVVKMDGQKQVSYPRKNWSSVIFFNCGHKANRSLTTNMVNNAHPSVLHRFGWLDDSEIGELPVDCNWLEYEYNKHIFEQQYNRPPSLIHYTCGGPWFKEVKDSRIIDYGDLWEKEYDELV